MADAPATSAPTLQDINSLLAASGQAPISSTDSGDQTQAQPAQQTTETQPARPSGAPVFSAEGDVQARQKPAAYGMRVATPQDVTNFEDAVSKGFDPTTLPVSDQLAITLAKDPNFFAKDQNFDAYYDYIYKPLKAQGGGTALKQFLQNLVPELGQMVKNVGAGIASEANDAKDMGELFFRKATGQTQDAGYQALLGRLGTEQATQWQGVGGAINGAANFLIGVPGGAVQLTKPIAQLVMGRDPQSSEQIDRAYARIMQRTVAAQQETANLGNQTQNLAANAYKSVGGLADLGEKLQNATPDERAASGLETLYNPLNFVGFGAGTDAVGALKTLFFERGTQAAEDVSGQLAKKAVLDASQILPENPELAAARPGYVETRNVQAGLAPEARAASADLSQATQDLNARLTSLNQIAGDPGAATAVGANLLQAAGTTVDAAGQAASALTKFPEWIASKLPLPPEAQEAVADGLHKYVFGTVLHHWGGVGAAIETAIEHLPKVGAAIKDLTSAMGQELMMGESSVPFWTRVSQRTTGISKGMAAFLDSPAMVTAQSMVAGGAEGAAVGGVLGGLQGAGSTPGGGMQGFLGGAAQGGIFGMAGGGLGQWMKYRDPNQYLLQARGDWKRYRSMLNSDELQNFSQLSPTNQLILAQHQHQFPGLKVNYVNDPTGPSGFHYVDQANRSNIQVNLAAPESIIRGTMLHELTHAATQSGMLPEILDTLLGNPERSQIGQYTALDADRNPIGTDPTTGRYQTNQEFANIRNEYINQMQQNGLPTSHLTDADIAKEIYAEHGVDYMMSGGALLDANSAFRPGLYSEAAMKTALAKMGFTFDGSSNMIGSPGGTIGGTGLFRDLQRNPDLMRMAQTFFQKRGQEGAINSEEQSTRRFTRRDMQNPNVSETWLQNDPQIIRDENGKTVRNPLTGEPAYRTPNQVKEYNAKFADALKAGVEGLPEDQRMDVGYRKTGENSFFVRYLPDSVLDSLAKTNEYNPNQIASLRMLSKVLADKGNPGMEMRLFYRKATTPSKRYGSFEGTEKFAVPYGFEVSGQNNVNIKSVDFGQLGKNFQRVMKRDPYKSLWKNEGEFDQDAHTYFVNHSKGDPGATGIGEAKRDAINALANFGTLVQRDANPLVDRMPNSVRSIIKDYSIDRANQISATGAKRPFISEDQYRLMNRNYLPRKGAFQSVSPEDFIAARNKTTRPEFLSDLKAEDLGEHRLYTNEAGNLGVALSPQGDIQNVFNNSGVPGAGAHAIAHAIQQGGRTLDAYDDFLPRLYRQFGFQETGRMKFNDQFAPANWDYAKRGRPDVVFMGWNGYPTGGRSGAIERAQRAEMHWLPNERSTKYSDDWDRQKDASRAFATGTADYRLPAEGSRAPAYGAGGQQRAATGEGDRPYPVDTTAIPVTYRQTRTGKTVEQEIPYGITSAPLVADKQPPANLTENNFGHVDFLTKPDQQKLTHLDKASAVTDYADKIVQDYDTRWKGTGLAKEAKSWYRDVRKYLTQAFGGDKELFAHLLAATSAGQGVVQNWKDSLEAYQRYRAGHYDDAIREFKRTGQITEDMKPTKANGAKFGQNSDDVLKVLAGTWLDSVEGPKTPNFFRNLFGRGTDATIDMWAARTMRRLGYEGVEGAPDQWRITPPSEAPVTNLDFAFSQQAFKQAADRLGMKAHELQAIMWYGEKQLWAERGWAKGGAQAAKESYVPRLKEFAEQVSAAGGPESAGYLPRLQKYVQGR